MTAVTILGIVLFLTVIFTVLGLWHRAVLSAEDEAVTKMIHQAEEEGASQALTQHPQIDVSHCVGCGSCVLACPEHGVLAVVEGKARLVRASHCVGHGCCEQACPVGALTVGLGDTSARDDIPQLSEVGETTIPSVFIAGELGGIGLICHAISQGTAVANAIANRIAVLETSTPSNVVDVLIVGCGPAGIAAALRAHELELSFTIMDQDGLGGSVRKYPRNKMTLTQPVELPVFGKMKRTQYVKEELIELWESVFSENDIHVRGGIKFLSLEKEDSGTLSAETSEGAIRCRNCLLALGRRGTPRRLNVPGEEAEHVLYQLIDAADYVNNNLLVVGGGDSAIEAALALATQAGNKVVISYRRNAFFRIKARNRERLDVMEKEGRIRVLFNSQVHSIVEGRCRIIFESGAEDIPADFVFVMAGGEPPYPMLKQIGIEFGGAEADERAVV